MGNKSYNQCSEISSKYSIYQYKFAHRTVLGVFSVCLV